VRARSGPSRLIPEPVRSPSTSGIRNRCKHHPRIPMSAARYSSSPRRRGGGTMTGPLQVIAVSFGPGAEFRGRVLAEVDRLQGRGMLRLLDLLVVAKNPDGTMQRLSVGDDEDFGQLLASILPVDAAGPVMPPVGE